MNRTLVSLIVSAFAISFTFSAITKGPVKDLKMKKLQKSRMQENEPTVVAREASYWNKPHQYSLRNGASAALVDSSGNGYGMVSSVTRPIDSTEDYLSIAYRQYCGVGTTHGQLGGAVSEDGEEWEAYFNLNANGNPPWGGGAGVGNGSDDTAQARYPSALATDDFPFALWNEYTGVQPGGSQYGGRLYYTYDEFGWEGGSYAYPSDLDLLWGETKDLWTASPDMFTDGEGQNALAVSAADWSRSNNYYFRSEFVDGVIVMGEEQIVIDEANCLVAGDASGSFNTAPMVAIDDNTGYGVMGIIGLFPGGDEGTSDISNYHQPIFKITTDYGQTWQGPDAADDCSFYHMPDSYWQTIIDSWDDVYIDECGGYEYFIVDFWSYYDFDYKVDSAGNLHILMTMVPSDDYYVFWIDGAGWYHFSASLEDLAANGQDADWSWSQVADMQDTWIFSDNDGETNIWQSMASLSFAQDNSDVVWVVLNQMNEYACGEVYDDAGTEDPCDDLYEYPSISQDLFVYKSTDGGATWWNPLNATSSIDNPDDYPASWQGVCPDGLIWCGPEEQYPHAPQWSTEDEVYYMFQMPNWGFNEIGDLLGADHMNRVYVGKAEVTSDTEGTLPDCDDTQVCGTGDTNGDTFTDVLDIVAIVNNILGTLPLDDFGLCAGDMNLDGMIDVLDIVAVVNIILGNRVSDDASQAKFIRTANGLSMESDGYVGGFEMTLSHGPGFDLDLVAKSVLDGVSAFNTNGNTTKLVVVTPIEGEIFTSNSDFSIENVVAVNSEEYIASPVVDGYVIAENYPNPFNPSTTISYDLIGASNVNLTIYNVMGQEVATLVNDFKATGSYEVVWNGTNSNGLVMPSGLYIMKLETEHGIVSNKLSLLR